MKRLSAAFVSICMVLITGSMSAILYLAIGLSGPLSALTGIMVLAAFAAYNGISARLAARAVEAQLAELSRGVTDLARQVAELAQRVGGLGHSIQTLESRAPDALGPISAELSELGVLVRQLAEAVAAHEAALQASSLVPATTSPAPATGATGAPPGAREAAPPTERSSEERRPLGALQGRTPQVIIAMINEAIEADRIELFLQPIVTLPQRKARHYEALARLRSRDGETLTATDFLPFAEACGALIKIDRTMLFRCVQVVERLRAKNREIGLFLNISPSTLVDIDFFPQVAALTEANRTLAPCLVFEFTQSAYRAMGPLELESLAALADRGFRFSMDQVVDLRLEPRDLASRGFRFLKVPAALLLDKTGATGSDIDLQDLSGLLSRFGIDLIAERIESEATVVDLLDYEVKYAQGLLFSPPRAVRPDLMRTAGSRGELGPREAGRIVEARRLSASGPAGGARPTGAMRPSALAPAVRGAGARP